MSESGYIPHKRSHAWIIRKLGEHISSEHPDWPAEKIGAQLTKAEIGLGPYARARADLGAGILRGKKPVKARE